VQSTLSVLPLLLTANISLKVSVPSFIPKTLLYRLPTFFIRTSGHWLGTLVQRKFLVFFSKSDISHCPLFSFFFFFLFFFPSFLLSLLPFFRLFVSCFKRLMWYILISFEKLAKACGLLTATIALIIIVITARSCDSSKSKANASWNVLYCHLFDRRNVVGSKSLLGALPQLRNEMCRKNNACSKTGCVRVFA